MKLFDCEIGDIIKMNGKLHLYGGFNNQYNRYITMPFQISNNWFVRHHNEDVTLMSRKNTEFKLYLLRSINIPTHHYISTIIKQEHDYFEGLDENNKLVIISGTYSLQQI